MGSVTRDSSRDSLVARSDLTKSELLLDGVQELAAKT